jgi:hypothetical protein
MARIGGRDVATYDLGVLGAGLLVFIASFLPWYGVKIDHYSGTTSGWHSGFLAWFPILLSIAIAAAVAAQALGRARVPSVGPLQPALVLTIVSAFALLLIIIRWATLPDVPAILVGQAKAGARAGLFLGLFGALGLTAFNALRLVTGAGQAPTQPGYPYGQQPAWPQTPQPGTPIPGTPAPGTWQQPQQGWQQPQQPQQPPSGWQQPQQGGAPQGQQGWQQYPPQQYPPQEGGQQGWQQYPPQPPQGGWPQNQ